MPRVFVTGSADGLGLMAAKLLLEEDHEVLLHARNPQRAQHALEQTHGAPPVAIGDLSTLAGIRSVAEQVNAQGPFDAIIHNAAVGYQERARAQTEDGLPHIFTVNTLAPYLLTALIHPRPARLVFLSSSLHAQGTPNLDDPLWSTRPWNGQKAYSDTKLHDTLLAFGIARRWPQVLSNSVDPGWVATKMGGPSASDDLAQGHLTQVWLATSTDPAAQVTGEHFYHLKPKRTSAAARNEALQDQLLALCEELTGVALQP